MHLEISPQDGTPIYRQIVSQITYLIVSQQLRSDHELPPIRALAEQLSITPNTVAKAYRELEVAGLIYKRQGAGTFVADIKHSPLARREQRRVLMARADALLVDARHLGFSYEEVLKILAARQAALENVANQEQQHAG